MNLLNQYLETIDNYNNQQKFKAVLDFVFKNFPSLEFKFAWNQPMFTNQGTFIIGFSVAKQHFSIAPESLTIAKFKEQIISAGYEITNNLFRIKWTDDVNYELLTKIIEFNIIDKKDYPNFGVKISSK